MEEFLRLLSLNTVFLRRCKDVIVPRHLAASLHQYLRGAKRFIDCLLQTAEGAEKVRVKLGVCGMDGVTALLNDGSFIGVFFSRLVSRDGWWAGRWSYWSCWGCWG
jgi:hypothetical protein